MVWQSGCIKVVGVGGVPEAEVISYVLGLDLLYRAVLCTKISVNLFSYCFPSGSHDQELHRDKGQL